LTMTLLSKIRIYHRISHATYDNKNLAKYDYYVLR
jgi:hypothetical protein